MNKKYEKTEDYLCAAVTYKVTETITQSPNLITNKLPKLPINIWNSIVTWLCDISGKNNSEAVCSLTVINGEWKTIVWHQEAVGTLHVNFDESSEENLQLVDEETRKALNAIHCTIHSHNKMGASQSNNDKDDERTKLGWHVTIGNCDKPELSTHARFNVQRNAVFGNEEKNKGIKIKEAYQEFIEVNLNTIIEEIPEFPNIPTMYLKPLEDVLKTNHKVPYPKEWLENVKNKSSIGYHNIHNQKKTNTRVSGQYYQGTNAWGEKDFGMLTKGVKDIWNSETYEIYDEEPIYKYKEKFMKKHMANDAIYDTIEYIYNEIVSQNGNDIAYYYHQDDYSLNDTNQTYSIAEEARLSVAQSHLYDDQFIPSSEEITDAIVEISLHNKVDTIMTANKKTNPILQQAYNRLKSLEL
jgi:hypothetical protein